MAFQPFLIANTRVGVERDIEPWLLPNDAYPDLEDCYIWRGRIAKRQGYELLGRLQRIIGTTDGSGNATITLPNTPLTAGLSQFQVGTTVYQDPTGASPITLLVDGVGTASLNRSTGVLTILGAPISSQVIYFPGLPVMGLRSLETVSQENVDGLVAFDTSFSYLFSGTEFQDLTTYKSSTAPFNWHGSNSQFFWTANYQKAMFTTNDLGGIDGHAYNTLTAGATTSIVVTGVNVTASFAVNDYVFIYPNSTTTTFPMVGTVVEYQGSGIITSSTFGGGNTTIVVAVATTTNSNTGTLYNVSRNIGNGTTTGDSIKWLDQDKSGWVNFQPPLNGSGTSTNYLQSCTMIFPYKGYLVVLNTTEDTFAAGTPKTYQQRARWSQNGTAYYSNPVPTNYTGGVDPQAWRDDVVGKGGFIDASTLEAIVSAQFLKDTLIVYFERSTWQLAFTGDQFLPFVWVKINTELGCESTFSIVPFDKETIALGNVGIHQCDTVNVSRIDARIPDEVFNINKLNSGVSRVYGIRDFFKELVYWTMPYLGIDTEEEMGVTQALTFPNKIMVYNYRDKSFSFFNDSFTCFGYFQPGSSNVVTWGSPSIVWARQDVLWSDPQDSDALTTVAIGGNQLGFVEILMQQSFNDDSMFISNISGSTVTLPNHNLQPGQFVKLTSASGITSGINVIYKVVAVTSTTFTLNIPVIGTFTGSGTLTVVNNISIQSKRFNPFIDQAAQVRLGYTDLYVDKTTNGQLTINLYNNEDSSTPINQIDNAPISTVSAVISNITAANPCVVTVPSPALFSVNDVVFFTLVNGMTQINNLGAIVAAVGATTITLSLDASTFSAYTSGGTMWNISKNTGNALNTFPETTYQSSPDTKLVNAKLWKRLYYYDIGQLFQYQITYSDTQMVCEPIVQEDIVLHGVILWFSKSGRLIDV